MTSTATIDPPTVDQDLEPGRDPRLEALLERHHVEWTFDPAYPLADIDITRSLKNQARADSEPLLEETVELYTHHYREGVTFPGLLLRRTSPRARKTYALGGNHRTTAALAAGHTTHPAYIVVCTDEAATSLMYEDNMANGAQLPKRQRLAIAAYLCGIGYTQDRAAREMGVTQAEVSNFRKLHDTNMRAVDAKVTGFEDLPAGLRVELGRIQSDPVFAETARLMVATKMQGTDATRVIKTVKAARSDEQALRFVGSEFESRREEVQRAHAGAKAGKYQKRTSYGTLNAALTDIAGLNPRDVAGSIPPSANKAQLRERLRAAAETLFEIAKAVK